MSRHTAACLLAALAMIGTGLTIVTTNLVVAGPLDPPAGPITPTFKTLAEVEPRIPISLATTPGDEDSLFKITAPGSYYLTGNVPGVPGKTGIEIAAAGVTLDLNGFALIGVPGSLHGVRDNPGSGSIAIRNGSVLSWASGGIVLPNAVDARIEHVTATGNTGNGIAAVGGVISNCTATHNTSRGISVGSARVTGSLASHNGSEGFYLGDGSSVTECVARSNGLTGFAMNGSGGFANCVAANNGDGGFLCGYGCTYTSCAARNNEGRGFSVNYGSIATECSAYGNTLDGFTVSGSVINCQAYNNQRDGIHLEAMGGAAIGNTCRGNGNSSTSGAGIRAAATACRIDSNQLSENYIGIAATGDCVVVRNTARGNTTNYSFSSGTEYGQILTNPGSAFVNSNPWANFAY